MKDWDTVPHKELMILNIIAESPDVNQRQISQKVSMGLGMVNLYVNRLIDKGYVKIKAVPRRRYLYYLTPRGFAEKSHLTYEYMRYSLQLYGEMRSRCRGLFGRLVEDRVAQIGFIGKSELAEIAFLTLQEFPIKFGGLFDDSACGEVFLGLPVRPVQSAAVLGLASDCVLLYTYSSPPALSSKSLEKLDYLTLFES